nr:MAG TPA: ATPase [Caudoviricetes sp.]
MSFVIQHKSIFLFLQLLHIVLIYVSCIVSFVFIGYYLFFSYKHYKKQTRICLRKQLDKPFTLCFFICFLYYLHN